jgi:hypothetical protein
MKKLSPLIPRKGGYQIPLGQPGSNIQLEDLEPEISTVIKKTKDGEQIRLVQVFNPFLMKGAQAIIREQNMGKEEEIESVAIDMRPQWIRAYRAPSAPLLKPNARDSTEDEQAEALVRMELERRKKRLK